jgi:hypothetical protein
VRVFVNRAEHGLDGLALHVLVGYAHTISSKSVKIIRVKIIQESKSLRQNNLASKK